MTNFDDDGRHSSDEGLSPVEPMDLSYCPPPPDTKILIVDLDETLIFYNARSHRHIDQFEEELVLVRPYAGEFLYAANANGYLVVCWTAGTQPVSTLSLVFRNESDLISTPTQCWISLVWESKYTIVFIDQPV